MDEFRKILVPVDGSELSEKALEKALSLSETFHSQVTMVHVVGRTAVGSGPIGYEGPILKTDQSPYQDEEAAKKVFARDEDRARTRGITVRSIMKRGDPASEIVKLSAEYDMIIIGAHGGHHIEHMIMGSVADKVTHHACCPVLVIRENKCEK